MDFGLRFHYTPFQVLGLCHTKMRPVRQVLTILFKIPRVNFFPGTRYMRSLMWFLRTLAHYLIALCIFRNDLRCWPISDELGLWLICRHRRPWFSAQPGLSPRSTFTAARAWTLKVMLCRITLVLGGPPHLAVRRCEAKLGQWSPELSDVFVPIPSGNFRRC